MLLLEMQCEDWEHNRVNAGMIKLCKASFPEEKIKLYAEQKHINELNKMMEQADDIHTATAIEFTGWRADSFGYRQNYEELLISIIKQELDEKKIILLSSNKGIVMAVSRVSKQFPEKKFYTIFHAALEEVIQEHSKKELMDIKFSRLKSKIKGRTIELTMRECINKCSSSNCNFILYAPSYKESLSGKISKEILNRFIFLHHPLYETNNSTGGKNSKLIIGIYGQAVNQSAYDIVKCYNQKYDNDNVRFKVMVKENNPILGLNNVSRLFKHDYVSNDELEQARQTFDFMLIPYIGNQYRVTASGILCDAISEEIPVLMLNSPLLCFYHQYNIGLLRESIDEMAKLLSELKREDITIYKKAERSLKNIVLEENVKTIRERMNSV